MKTYHRYIMEENKICPTEIFDPQELSAAVLNTIKYYQEEYEDIKKENENLRNNAKKIVRHEYEEEIKHLKERLDLSYGEFSSEKEKNAYINFQEEHMHDRMISRANGGKAPYLIPTHTGIGTILKVVCPICGESKDITDDEVW